VDEQVGGDEYETDNRQARGKLYQSGKTKRRKRLCARASGRWRLYYLHQAWRTAGKKKKKPGPRAVPAGFTPHGAQRGSVRRTTIIRFITDALCPGGLSVRQDGGRGRAARMENIVMAQTRLARTVRATALFAKGVARLGTPHFHSVWWCFSAGMEWADGASANGGKSVAGACTQRGTRAA